MDNWTRKRAIICFGATSWSPDFRRQRLNDPATVLAFEYDPNRTAHLALLEYADGEKDRRIWSIKKVNDNTYTGTAPDIIGTAQGQAFGNALNWVYEMDLKVGSGSWRVKFDDWMFLQPGGVLLNRATVTKYGLQLGIVTLSFSRVDDGGLNATNQMQRAAE